VCDDLSCIDLTSKGQKSLKGQPSAASSDVGAVGGR